MQVLTIVRKTILNKSLIKNQISFVNNLYYLVPNIKFYKKYFEKD